MQKLLCKVSALLLAGVLLAGCACQARTGITTANLDTSERTAVSTEARITVESDFGSDEPITGNDPLTSPDTTSDSADPATESPNSDETSDSPETGANQPSVTVQTPATAATDKPLSSATSIKPAATTAKPTTISPVTTAPPVNEPAKGTQISIYFTVNNSAGGHLSGNTSQVIRYGETKTTQVTAVAELGYKFIGWSDGVATASRNGESPKKSGTVTALFAFDPLELPIISITTENGAKIVSKTEYINGTISVLNCDEKYEITELAMQIRGRGNYTWNSQYLIDGKVPYKIKLSSKQNLLGEGSGKAKVWTLIADHCDQALLRNYTVLNFARSLSGIDWNSAAQSVELYLNGEYRGVFLLCEQNQVNEFRVNVNDDVNVTDPAQRGYLIEMSGYAYQDEDPYFTISNTSSPPYSVKSDLPANTALANRQIEYISDYVQRCWDAVQSGDQTKVAALIDINSAVDTYIVEELFKNLDAGWDSFYFHKDAGGKLVFGPIWDFDQSGGNADEGCENYEGLRGGETNAWYKELLKHSWFRNLVMKRWNELKPQIDKIPSSIITQAKAGYNSYCRNFDRWPIFGQKINRETAAIRALSSYKEHYEYYSRWMQNRINWMDSYVNSTEYSFNGVLTLQGSGTKTNPYRVATPADFQNFILCMKSGQTFSGKYFKQTADLDLTQLTGYSGVGSSATFAGIYDGCGYSIHAVIQGTDGCIFPYLTGTVMNLVTQGSITNSAQAAGICRSVRNGGIVINCASFMTLSGSYAGGITASNETGGGSILNCYFGGSVTGYEAASPINCYSSGRGGLYENNYYTDGITHTTQGAWGVNTDETAVNALQVASKVPAYLNSSIASSAEKVSGISASDLCSWQAVSGKPILVKK